MSELNKLLRATESTEKNSTIQRIGLFAEGYIEAEVRLAIIKAVLVAVCIVFYVCSIQFYIWVGILLGILYLPNIVKNAWYAISKRKVLCNDDTFMVRSRNS